jgi:HEPN domain-containing protein
MRLEKLVLKRFEELKQESEEILDKKVVDFVSNEGKTYYEIPLPLLNGWGTKVLNLLVRTFGENNVHYNNFFEKFKSSQGSLEEFEICKAIFLAAKEDYEGGYLFNVRSLIKAEVLSDALDQATQLLDAGYKDPACVLIGVALESTLKELCTREGIPLGKLDKMNVELCKAELYNMVKQKQITAWADIRNKAAHGDWGAYSEEDAKDFLEGVKRFTADYL